MKTQLAIFIALVATSSLSFGATLNAMNQDQLKQVFIGKTITSISTAQEKGIDNGFAVYLEDKGNIYGKFTQASTKVPQTDQGVYRIKDDGLLCITWQHWFRDEECLYIYDTQNAYIAVDNQNTFHTVFMKSDIQSGIRWIYAKSD